MPGLHVGLGDDLSDLLALAKQDPSVNAGVPMSTGAKVAIGLSVVSATALGLWWYTHRHFENPALPPEGVQPEQFSRGTRKTSLRQPPKRRVSFRVRLGVSPAYDYVVLFPNGTAILYRKRYAVVKFRPAPYQLGKIRNGEGDLLIYADQILESLVGR